MKAKRFYKHTKKNTHEKGKRVLNTVLIVLMIVWYIAAFVLWINGADNDDMPVMFAGIGMFPLGSLIISVNAVKYALKDLKGWRRIFTKPRLPQNDEFYVLEDPSFLHKALTRAVLKEQFLNIIVMIVVPIFLLVYNGYVAKYKDVTDLAEGIQYVLTHDMREAALHKAASAYGETHVAQKYINVYESR